MAMKRQQHQHQSYVVSGAVDAALDDGGHGAARNARAARLSRDVACCLAAMRATRGRADDQNG